MALFLRLWVVRHRYEQLRPFGRTAEECLEFHLEQLRESWERVISCQKALGLEVRPFTPEEHFQAIYIVSGYVDRSIAEARGAHPGLGRMWRDYVQILNALSHDDNPFDFSDRCQDCGRKVSTLLESFKAGFILPDSEPETIPFQKALSAMSA